MAQVPPNPAPRRGYRNLSLKSGCGILLFLCIGLAFLSQVFGSRNSGSNTAAVVSAPTSAPVGGQAAAPVSTAALVQSKATDTPKAPAATVTERPPASTATPPPHVGDTVTSGNWEYTVTQVKREKGPLVWSQYGNKTSPAGEWLIIDISLKNIGKQNFGINTHDFELVDDKGVKYAHSTANGATSSFQEYQKLTALGGQVPPGLAVNSALVFDINPAATGLKLILKQAKDAAIDLGQ
jgi:hypothetical protein